jgi:hypothetical protein
MCTKLACCGNETLGKVSGCSATSGEACPTRVSGLILARELIRGGATSLALLFTSSHGVCSSSVRRNPLSDRIPLAISWVRSEHFPLRKCRAYWSCQVPTTQLTPLIKAQSRTSRLAQPTANLAQAEPWSMRRRMQVQSGSCTPGITSIGQWVS